MPPSPVGHPEPADRPAPVDRPGPTAPVDVILPVLDEAAAIPTVLAGLPAGYRALVVDNGSTDGSAEVARAHGAVVVTEPRRGFGAACWAGLTAATAPVVAFMDCDGSFAGADLPRVVDPVVEGRADLVLGARQAAPGAWPWHARTGNRVLAGYLRRRSGVAVTDLGPMRAARRRALLDLGLTDRGFGWPLEMVLRASGAGWRIHEVQVGYAPRIGRSKVTGTVRGTARAVRDMSRIAHRVGREAPAATRPDPPTTLVVIAKAPRPGFSKTRLTPPCTPEQAAALAEAALRDTLEAVGACPADRRVVVLDGEPGPWCPDGVDVVPQRGGGLDERLAAAFTDVAATAPDGRTGPMLLIGMDTPQVNAALLADALDRLRAPGWTPSSGRPPTAGGGRSASTAPHPSSSSGCR